jgi:hypothetical protein
MAGFSKEEAHFVSTEEYFLKIPAGVDSSPCPKLPTLANGKSFILAG